MVDRAEVLGAVDSWDSASKLAAKDALKAGVDTAVDAGVSWQAIGTPLGIRRGAAYQRFRHRLRIEVTHQWGRPCARNLFDDLFLRSGGRRFVSEAREDPGVNLGLVIELGVAPRGPGVRAGAGLGAKEHRAPGHR
jgi:hypothetical protein